LPGRGNAACAAVEPPSLNTSYVNVTAADRFDVIREDKADLLCEPTSSNCHAESWSISRLRRLSMATVS
jgi:hypothetical protein